MKTLVPSYYPAFRCIADKCRHTCCKGWEIDIDDDTLDLYRQYPGPMGERLRQSIDWEQHCFRLDQEENCPFLNRQGLCDIILTMGEGALCQICDDHPRFRNETNDRVEMGLGLCCEAAGKLILSWQEPVQMILWDDDGFEDEEDEDFLRWRDGVISMAQDRRFTVAQRVENILQSESLAMQVDDAHWAEYLLGLERLEESWAIRLKRLRTAKDSPLPQGWEIPMEQLLVYLLMRHLAPAWEDGDRQGRLLYCMLMWRLLHCMAEESNGLEGLVELARQYSSEIEYSDENMDAILDEIHACML